MASIGRWIVLIAMATMAAVGGCGEEQEGGRWRRSEEGNEQASLHRLMEGVSGGLPHQQLRWEEGEIQSMVPRGGGWARVTSWMEEEEGEVFRRFLLEGVGAGEKLVLLHRVCRGNNEEMFESMRHFSSTGDDRLEASVHIPAMDAGKYIFGFSLLDEFLGDTDMEEIRTEHTLSLPPPAPAPAPPAPPAPAPAPPAPPAPLTISDMEDESPSSMCQQKEGIDLSVILAVRNDEHGGNFLERFYKSLESLSKFSWSSHGLRVEIVVCVWEDPPGKPLLLESLRKGGRRFLAEGYFHDSAVTIRLIEVPREVARAVSNPLNLSMPQYVAKNVAMRRSYGRYVLVTNADCLLGFGLAMAVVDLVRGREEEEERKRFFVAFRQDLSAEDSWLEFPFDGVAIVHEGEVFNPLQELLAESYPLHEFGNVYRETDRFLSLLNVGDFLLLPRRALEESWGYSEYHHPFGLDAELVCRLSLLHNFTATLIAPPNFLFHLYHPHAYNFSHPPFPWQEACEAYEAGKRHRLLDGWVRSDWGLAGQVLPEMCILPDGAVV
eukprot:763605-Hanusia_phi.AAC.2